MIMITNIQTMIMMIMMIMMILILILIMICELQVIAGNRTQRFPGVFGIGPVIAERILKEHSGAVYIHIYTYLDICTNVYM